jgi:hypothetical protein
VYDPPLPTVCRALFIALPEIFPAAMSLANRISGSTVGLAVAVAARAGAALCDPVFTDEEITLFLMVEGIEAHTESGIP